MKPRPMVVTLAVALTAGIALVPAAARADRLHERGNRVIVSGHPVGARTPFVHSHSRFAHPFGHHRPFVFHRPFVPFVVAAAPPVVYAAPPVYYAPPAYYPPPVYYAPPPASSAPQAYGPPANGTASSASTPNVVQHPHGRYELRGDGVSVPYRWVWIPNPPPPPPQVDPPIEPGGRAPSDPSGARRQSELYRWTDEQGVVHWTDRRDAVPERYHGRAKQTRPS